MVIHPAIHTGLCVWLCYSGEGAIQMKEMPLWLNIATAFIRSQVGVQGDGDPQEVILAQDPTVIIRVGVIVNNVNPAVMTKVSCSEVFQYYMRHRDDIADKKESHLKDLESSMASN